MPELPEVEVTRQGLQTYLPDRRVLTLAWSGKTLRQQPFPLALLKQHICHNRIHTIDRRAKYLLIRMNTASVLVLHLGMTGRLGLFPSTTARTAHDHLCCTLDNGMELRFNDSRRFGMVMVWPSQEAARLEEDWSRNQGIEPFGPDFTAEHVMHLAKHSRRPIKNFLMDSEVIAGIGNIYANEILFAAGIHPQTAAGSLNREQWQGLVSCCRNILQQAIAAGGSSISDFLGSDGQPGWFQLQLAVYGKTAQACPRCGHAIHKEVLGGRATFFCVRCQVKGGG